MSTHVYLFAGEIKAQKTRRRHRPLKRFSLNLYLFLSLKGIPGHLPAVVVHGAGRAARAGAAAAAGAAQRAGGLQAADAAGACVCVCVCISVC